MKWDMSLKPLVCGSELKFLPAWNRKKKKKERNVPHISRMIIFYRPQSNVSVAFIWTLASSGINWNKPKDTPLCEETFPAMFTVPLIWMVKNHKKAMMG